MQSDMVPSRKTLADFARARSDFNATLGLSQEGPEWLQEKARERLATLPAQTRDRMAQPSSPDQVAPVAQRVVLYDEDPSDPKGKQYVGSVIWRTEPIKASGNQKA